jgi:hypothetical protein
MKAYGDDDYQTTSIGISDLATLPYGHAQTTDAPTSEPSQAEIRQQFTDMIQGAIKQSTENYAKAKRLGDKATPVLEEYLQAKEYFQQLLAIRLLDEIGTDTSRDVLGEFAEKADNAATRSYALDFLM